PPGRPSFPTRRSSDLAVQPPQRVPLWRNPTARAVAFQAIAIAVVLVLAVYLVSTTIANLEQRGIRSGFGFLENEAGFRIGETLIDRKSTRLNSSHVKI